MSWFDVPPAVVAGLREELESEGFVVSVSDAELAWASFEPWDRARERVEDAFADLGRAAEQATTSLERLRDALETQDHEDSIP